MFRQVIEYMGEVLLLDPQKAEQLQQCGFKYTKRNIDNKEVFVFIQTNELMKELNSKFEQGIFLLNSNVCFQRNIYCNGWLDKPVKSNIGRLILSYLYL